MNRLAFLVPLSLLVTNKEEVRLEESATVVKEILDIPDGIPQELLDKAECVIVLPSVKKLAVGIGGSYGKGALVCRSGEDFKGAWGPPRSTGSRAETSACSSAARRPTSSCW